MTAIAAADEARKLARRRARQLVRAAAAFDADISLPEEGAMAEHTKIEWADHTWNPWIGCTKVSPACDHCYAERFGHRFGVEWGNHERRRTSEANWRKPMAWNRRAQREGRPAFVFCASLADVFDNQVPIQWRRDLWDLIESTPHLVWLLLTKRPQNIHNFLPPWWGDGLPNVWLGTTVENQDEADRRVPHLLAAPAARRFLSCEPLLGHVDLYQSHPLGDRLQGAYLRGLDWVIAGGESGPKARPSHPDWFRSLRDQCATARVPFFFKQWGEWVPWQPGVPPEWTSQAGGIADGNVLFPENMDDDPHWDDGLSFEGEATAAFQRLGKRHAGRLLDGRQHDARPPAIVAQPTGGDK